MAVTHTVAVRNSVVDFTLAKINVTPPGKLKFRLTGTAAAPGTAVATLTFAAASFGAAAGGVATAAAITSDTNAVGNASPVATATFEDSGGAVIVHCQVAASASDINMSGGLTVAPGDTVSCSSLTYTGAP